MEETIDNNFSDTQDVLNILFSQSSKMNLLDKLYRNLVALNLGDAYNNLYNKLGDLFNDKTNGKKYFNNLVNILEILDWAQTKYYGFNDNYFQILWNKFKSSDKINDFINLVKSFEATDSEYMFVVKGENGNEFKTPGLQITRAHILFDNDEVIIASDISNTCKTGSTIKDQFDKLGLDPYDDAVNDSLNKYQRNYLTTAQKLNRDVFGVGSSAITFLLALKKIKDQYEWETKILNDYDLTLQDLKNLVEKINGYHIYNTARLLSKPEDDKILFYNVPIRGKGNGDFNHIDSEEFELFSMFDKDSMFKLNRYHLGRNDNWNGILHFSKYGANFLFDKVSYDQDKGKGEEGYEAKTSLLTDLGKKITKTGLKWFLDENEYEITDKCAGIKVEEKVKAKRIEKDINTNINIINTNNNLLSEEKKISDQEIFNQISNVEKDIDHEVEVYADKFIGDVNNLFRIYFEQNQMLQSDEINTHSSNYNNAGAVNQEIDSKINQFINDFCDAYKNGLVKI
ncbi:MAG: hypothetical protein IJU86_03835, partial [Firmicutes bacterium]|nr:hypothetical protein [Bacillota bacterium]